MMSPKNINHSEEILKRNQLENDMMINNGKESNSFLSTFNRKRRHLFDVDLKVERVLSLPYASGKFFFKIRLLNGGNHVYTCHQRFEIHENKVEFNLNDHFSVKMTSRVDTFTLDHCFCRISIRKEGRAGRSYEKIGYYDLDLASVAGSGNESKACLLNAYQQANTRPANAYLEIRMKLTVIQGDHIFRRPDNDQLYTKVDRMSLDQKSDSFPDECSSTISQSAGELYPPSIGNVHNRGHSRQASKSSVCSNYSTASNNSNNNNNNNNNSIYHENKPIRNLINESRQVHNSHSDPNMMICNSRQANDEEFSNQSQKRLINQRRTPFIDQFGDIQRRLHSTRVDANEIVKSVIDQTAKTISNPNGYLCLMLNKDGTAHVGSASSSQSLQTPSSSLFLDT